MVSSARSKEGSGRVDGMDRVKIAVKEVRPAVPQVEQGGPLTPVPDEGRGRPPAVTTGQVEEELQDWRDRALRLQAEMDNYRKRQQKLAQEQIETERRRLLHAFLAVVDDLERALDLPPGSDDGLRQGVELTHRAALHFLRQEGVERLEAHGQPFDPAWQEAVGTVDHRHTAAALNTVVQVLEPGYRLGEQLLRPARVVVAV